MSVFGQENKSHQIFRKGFTQGIRGWESKYQEVWKYRDRREDGPQLTARGADSFLEATGRAPSAACSLRLGSAAGRGRRTMLLLLFHLQAPQQGLAWVESNLGLLAQDSGRLSFPTL